MFRRWRRRRQAKNLFTLLWAIEVFVYLDREDTRFPLKRLMGERDALIETLALPPDLIRQATLRIRAAVARDLANA